MTKKFKILFLTALLAIILSGCSINFNPGAGIGGTGTGTTADGGVYKSLDKGATWGQKASILTTGARRNIAMVDIISLALDPGDNRAVYAGSRENGLYYSYDGGEGWQLAPYSNSVTVANVAVDPADKCSIYATTANKVLKSIDCSRTWSTIYFDNDLKVSITSLVIEYSNSNNIFIGTSRGEIIKSSDQGFSWKTLNRFGGQVDKIVINPANSKNMLVGAANEIFRSLDSGANWTSLRENLKNFNGGSGFRDLVIVRADKPTVFLAVNYGLLSSTDGGDTWSKIELITPETAAKINAVTVNPFEAKEIYYVTNTTFYRSLDGGKSWNTRQLPTSRAGWRLLIDPKNPSIIYMAVRQVNK